MSSYLMFQTVKQDENGDTVYLHQDPNPRGDGVLISYKKVPSPTGYNENAPQLGGKLISRQQIIDTNAKNADEQLKFGSVGKVKLNRPNPTTGVGNLQPLKPRGQG